MPSSFAPNFSSRRLASSLLRPVWVSTLRASATSSALASDGLNVMQERLLGLHFLGFFGIRRFHMGFAVQCGWIYDAIIHK